MSDLPFAYHITFGTYGTRLHGDVRGTIDRTQNKPGDPVVGRNEDWEALERASLNFDPVYLTDEQRRRGQAKALDVCRRGGWQYHLAACQTNHVHVLLTAAVEGGQIRPWLKRWLGMALSEKWPRLKDQTWWASGGSVKWIWKEEYFYTVEHYIRDQRQALS